MFNDFEVNSMFALRSISTIQYVKPLIRSYSRRLKRNPGIQHRKNAMDVPEVEEEDFEGFESDFMDVHKSHKEHVRDIKLQREKLGYLIVKRKYFKQNFPNFLTWHDKEQIKYLRSSDPEEWTIERLAESFPATPEIIQRVIRANYTKPESKILNHDKSVQKNWELLKKGEMKHLPEDLLKHLSKFTNRSLNFLQPKLTQPNKEISIKKKTLASTEFSDIITSYEELRHKKQNHEHEEPLNISHQNITPDPNNTDSGIIGEIRNKKPTTFKQLQEKIEHKALTGKTIYENEKQILQNSDNHTSQDAVTHILKPEDVVAISKNKYKSSGGSLVKQSQHDYSHLFYPEKIVIPKDIVQKDHIYKLNDCYYDHDGRFLYRVPGMDK
nr:unnamed protein product [Callosobruchus analis]